MTTSHPSSLSMPPENNLNNNAMVDDDGEEDDDHKILQTDPTGRFECYDICLGKGAYKEVYKAFDQEEGYEVAWNQLRIDHLTKRDISKILSEVKLLQSLHHENIINFFHVWSAKGPDGRERVYFITELMTSGTLKSYIKKTKGKLKPKVLKNWCRQILKGLNYLHTRTPAIIHRDLKCDNIFINGNNGVAKIGDLGLATIKYKEHISSVLGTPEFMAPELYDEKYDEKVDIYAFGMCLLEMITKEYPYEECTNQAQIFKKVTAGIKPLALNKVVDPEVKDFIELCIDHNPSRRPSAADLLQHPFLSADLNLAPTSAGVSSNSLTDGSLSDSPTHTSASQPSSMSTVPKTSQSSVSASPPPSQPSSQQNVNDIHTTSQVGVRHVSDEGIPRGRSGSAGSLPAAEPYERTRSSTTPANIGTSLLSSSPRQSLRRSQEGIKHFSSQNQTPQVNGHDKHTNFSLSISIVDFSLPTFSVTLKMTIVTTILLPKSSSMGDDITEEDTTTTTQTVKFPFALNLDTPSDIVTEMVREGVIRDLTPSERIQVERMMKEVVFGDQVREMVMREVDEYANDISNTADHPDQYGNQEQNILAIKSARDEAARWLVLLEEERQKLTDDSMDFEYTNRAQSQFQPQSYTSSLSPHDQAPELLRRVSDFSTTSEPIDQVNGLNPSNHGSIRDARRRSRSLGDDRLPVDPNMVSESPMNVDQWEAQPQVQGESTDGRLEYQPKERTVSAPSEYIAPSGTMAVDGSMAGLPGSSVSLPVHPQTGQTIPMRRSLDQVMSPATSSPIPQRPPSAGPLAGNKPCPGEGAYVSAYRRGMNSSSSSLASSNPQSMPTSKNSSRESLSPSQENSPRLGPSQTMAVISPPMGPSVVHMLGHPGTHQQLQALELLPPPSGPVPIPAASSGQLSANSPKRNSADPLLKALSELQSQALSGFDKDKVEMTTKKLPTPAVVSTNQMTHPLSNAQPTVNPVVSAQQMPQRRTPVPGQPMPFPSHQLNSIQGVQQMNGANLQRSVSLGSASAQKFQQNIQNLSHGVGGIAPSVNKSLSGSQTGMGVLSQATGHPQGGPPMRNPMRGTSLSGPIVGNVGGGNFGRMGMQQGALKTSFQNTSANQLHSSHSPQSAHSNQSSAQGHPQNKPAPSLEQSPSSNALTTSQQFDPIPLNRERTMSTSSSSSNSSSTAFSNPASYTSSDYIPTHPHHVPSTSPSMSSDASSSTPIAVSQNVGSL